MNTAGCRVPMPVDQIRSNSSYATHEKCITRESCSKFLECDTQKRDTGISGITSG